MYYCIVFWAVAGAVAVGLMAGALQAVLVIF